MINRLRETYHQFPPKFWMEVVAMFIDRLGGDVLWPFFTLYNTRKFSVGLTQAGVSLGTLFTLIGFGLYGFVAAVWLFAAALVVITVGEMIVIPASCALAANFAPEEMRGR